MKRWTLATVIILVGSFLILGTGCTQEQLDHWLAWRQSEPEVADEWVLSLRVAEPTPGNCSSYAPLFAEYGLPVATFQRIAWRESGCNQRSFVMDRDDAGGGLLGINLKGSLTRTWSQWCGATLGNITNAEVNVRCAAEAYQRLGMRPWS